MKLILLSTFLIFTSCSSYVRIADLNGQRSYAARKNMKFEEYTGQKRAEVMSNSGEITDFEALFYGLNLHRFGQK